MKRYEVSGFGVMEYEEVASTNSLAEKLPLSELKDKQVILTWRQTQGPVSYTHLTLPTN